MKMKKGFLSSTFREFNKCWRSGDKARVIMETFNGHAFINFSAYLGYPDDVHFQSRPAERNPPKKPRKKSAKKVKRDNERAAQFQKKKRQEEDAAASASTSGKFEYSFASPAREDLSNLSTSSTTDTQGQAEILRTNSDKEDSLLVATQDASSPPEPDEDDHYLNVSAPEESLTNSDHHGDNKLRPEEDEQTSSNEDQELSPDEEDEEISVVSEFMHTIDELRSFHEVSNPSTMRYFIHKTGLSKHLHSFKMSHNGVSLSTAILEKDIESFTEREMKMINEAYDYFETLLMESQPQTRELEDAVYTTGGVNFDGDDWPSDVYNYDYKNDFLTGKKATNSGKKKKATN